MKHRSFFCLILFLCTMQFVFVFSMQDGWFKTMMSNLTAKLSNLSSWNTVKELPKIPIGDARDKIVVNVSDVITDAVYRSYPIIKQQVVDWFYRQLSDIKAQIKYGLMVGGGIAVTGLTLFVIYKIYDKYLRHELTKEQTVDEIADVIYAMISDNLTYPTYSSKIHALLKKDEFLNYLNDTDALFAEACSIVSKKIAKLYSISTNKEKEATKIMDKVIAGLSANISKENIDKALDDADEEMSSFIASNLKLKDKEIDVKTNEIMNEIVSQQASITSNEQKLKYITENYIDKKDKFDIFLYALIGSIEYWNDQLMQGASSEKDMNRINQYIIAFKEELLKRLTIEQRAAYSLYLRLKNKIAVEKLLSPEGKIIRNPFVSQGSLVKKATKQIPQSG